MGKRLKKKKKKQLPHNLADSCKHIETTERNSSTLKDVSGNLGDISLLHLESYEISE